MNLSALMVARNEEKKIEKNIKSLNFVDEIVVVLDRSTDKTKKICKNYKASIFSGFWPCEGEEETYGINKCSSKWILEIDADEIISLKLANEIKQRLKIQQIMIIFFYSSFKPCFFSISEIWLDGLPCTRRKILFI